LSQATPQPSASATVQAGPGGAARPRIFDFSQLPSFSKSLLKVKVPLKVTLAGKKQSIQEILALGPGSILSFEKPCDAPVDISIGDHPIARGETVKVGEKFGVRVQEIILPAEHFQAMRPRSAG
jgi:flagellar motor switch protein FliN/FliY